MSSSLSNPQVGVRQHFSSSILLWMRTDQPRLKGMDHWKGPHSEIIAASPGLEEYRQIHLAETNPGLWPATEGVETRIPPDRKVDGVAEVTFQSALAPLKGRAQTKLAFKDEINVFRRTLLYAGVPNTSRWYDVAGPAESVGARALVYLRRRDGVSGRRFRRVIKTELVPALVATGILTELRNLRPLTPSLRRRFRRVIKTELVPALVATGILTELRTQTFLPWNRRTWDTPDVAHDNPADQRFHASLILGFADPAARTAFFEGIDIWGLSHPLAPVASGIHAYDVSEALTFVKAGEILAHYEE